jgi:hypothetical protein
MKIHAKYIFKDLKICIKFCITGTRGCRARVEFWEHGNERRENLNLKLPGLKSKRNGFKKFLAFKQQ